MSKGKFRLIQFVAVLALFVHGSKRPEAVAVISVFGALDKMILRETIMTNAIGGATIASQLQAVQTMTPQSKIGGKDSDGDHDGSKAGEVEKPTQALGSVGRVINTQA